MSPQDFEPAIRRARIDSLGIYEISESELQKLESGSPESNFLTFSVALLSIAISFTVTLTTTKIDSDRLFTTYISLTIIAYISGFILLILFWQKRMVTQSVICTIKNRMPPEGIPESSNTSNING